MCQRHDLKSNFKKSHCVQVTESNIFIFLTAEDEEWNEEGGVEETKTSTDTREDQTNEPASEDEGKEKETTEDSGETNAEDNIEGTKFFFRYIIGQEHAKFYTCDLYSILCRYDSYNDDLQ